ncbi:MAG: hypothetical protein JWQ11_1418 [Rhizobacter sp.]|nr:hypothetical protein [Rhizobacter sp.]
MDRATWIETFVVYVATTDLEGDRDAARQMAEQIYPSAYLLDPYEVACSPLVHRIKSGAADGDR